MAVPKLDAGGIGSELDRERLDPNRVIIVGASPSVEGVKSVAWDQLRDSGLSIADFSLVVMVLDSLDLIGDALTKTINALNPRYARLLGGPATELVLVGYGKHGHQVYNAVPVGMQGIAENGDFITDPDPEFAAYFALVDRYSAFLRPKDAPKAIQYTPLLKAAERDPLAVALKTPGESRIVLLPAPTRSDVDDAVTTLLVRHYGLDGGGGEPPLWLATVSLPSEESLHAEIKQLTDKITPLSERLDHAESDLAETRRLLGVLYETGIPLEALVRDLLRDLGAEVADPETPEMHDGTLRTPSGFNVVFEIKGRDGPIGVGDARQLFDWVDTLTYSDDESEPEDWKGLLIGNPHRHVPLDERAGLPAFSTNCVTFAKRLGLALITTSQLVDLLRLKQLGEFDATAWWEEVRETSGEVS